MFDDSSAAFARLQFQTGAGQIFADGPLPNIAPKVFPTFRPFTGLNPGRDPLEFFPRFGWLAIPILSQQVGAVHQNTNIGVAWYCHQLVTYRIASCYHWMLRRKLRAKVWL